MKLAIVFATVTAASPLLPHNDVVPRSLQARAPPNPPKGTEFFMTNPDQVGRFLIARMLQNRG